MVTKMRQDGFEKWAKEQSVTPTKFETVIWQAAYSAGLSAGLEEAAQIGVDYLHVELSDDEYWSGGRQNQEAVAKYVKEIQAAILQRKEGKV